MARISSEEALGALSLIGQLKASIDTQNEYLTQQAAELTRVKKELADLKKTDTAEGGEKK